jgi:hypothetical protein
MLCFSTRFFCSFYSSPPPAPLLTFTKHTAGDLLRAEQHRDGSVYGQLIRTCIREGQIVPMNVTVKLLEEAMREATRERSQSDQSGWGGGKGLFLIDGFPRKMDQAVKFEQEVCTSALGTIHQLTSCLALENEKKGMRVVPRAAVRNNRGGDAPTAVGAGENEWARGR